MADSFFKGFFNELGDQVNAAEAGRLKTQRDNAVGLKKANLQKEKQAFTAGESKLDRQSRLDVANINKDAKTESKNKMSNKAARMKAADIYKAMVQSPNDDPEGFETLVELLTTGKAPDEVTETPTEDPTYRDKVSGWWHSIFGTNKPETPAPTSAAPVTGSASVVKDQGVMDLKPPVSAAPTMPGMALPRSSAPPISTPAMGQQPAPIQPNVPLPAPAPALAATGDKTAMPVEQAISMLGQTPAPEMIQFFIDTYGAEALPANLR